MHSHRLFRKDIKNVVMSAHYAKVEFSLHNDAAYAFDTDRYCGKEIYVIRSLNQWKRQF